MSKPTIYTFPESWVSDEDRAEGSVTQPCDRCGIVLILAPPSQIILREASALRLDIQVLCAGHKHQVEAEDRLECPDEETYLAKTPEEFIELTRLEASMRATNVEGG